jgi:hypothetical protein
MGNRRVEIPKVVANKILLAVLSVAKAKQAGHVAHAGRRCLSNGDLRGSGGGGAHL